LFQKTTEYEVTTIYEVSVFYKIMVRPEVRVLKGHTTAQPLLN
jgi:hypothetical protein